MARVSITRTENDFYAAFARALADIGERPIIRGDHVLIKPNLVEPAAPDSGQITNPRVIEAVARYCLDSGATRVIIGEGPSYYQPQSYLRECFTRTGVSEVAERLGIEWVLFDEHRYRTFKGVSGYTPDEFRVSEFAFTCDKFINVPVLKTHYLTTVTLAMKNLKGCLIPLLSSLLLLAERDTSLGKPLVICLGKEPEVPEEKACLLVGDCARVEGRDELNFVGGCPPNREEILSHLMWHISE